MLNQTSTRVERAGRKRPVKPHHTASHHEKLHYAVHQACGWLYEISDAPIEALHDELMAGVDAKRLGDIATELLQHLFNNDDLIPAYEYAALYYQISQAFTPDPNPPQDK